ncbi:MAG: efflux RND transporter periplasmic adaptor subunit [Holosporaceae bacterium]|jgi:membrane fusion protein (multidrug efflux system)|nr:efflux RND transporter periplasmic adaptor subunit [Holosporaceae bacterium]
MSGKKIKYLLLFAIVVLLLVSYRLSRSKPELKIESDPAVMVVKANMGPVIRFINAIGTLRPCNSATIKAEVDSRVSKIRFSEGTVVKEGDLLVELDDALAKAMLMEAEGNYRKATSEYEPVEKLADRGVMARIHRDTKKAEKDVCEARVAFQRINFEKHKIYAPFGGIVGLREISPGQFVSKGADLIKIVDCHPMMVDFKVAEVDIGNVYVGQEAKILVGGDKNNEFSAKITAIDPESEKISHSFNIRAQVDIPEEVVIGSQILKPGRFVSIKIAPDGNELGVVIPESALEKAGEDYYVFRVVDGVAIRAPVSIGMRKDGMVEIITGINIGDVVITSGQHEVREGRGVSIQDSSVAENIVKELEKKVQALDNTGKRSGE